MSGPAKHTPGPWQVVPDGDWTGMRGVSLGIDDACGQDGGRDYHLATVVHGDPDELLANARLIAAAPDLLAMCEELSESAEYWSEYDVPLGIGERLNAAIAKARGTS